MTRSRNLEEALLAFLQSEPAILAKFCNVAKSVLSKQEYAAIRTQAGIYSPTLSEIANRWVEQRAYAKLCSHFAKARALPRRQQYLLEDLLGLANRERIGKSEVDSEALRQDLNGYIIENIAAISGHAVVFHLKNLMAVLYSKPISSVSSYRNCKSTLRRVVDLYYLSKKDIHAVAKQNDIPFGPLAQEALSQLLAQKGLPLLDQIVRDPM